MKMGKINRKSEIIVIGGGPAGLMAAGQAALAGAKVNLLEKKDRPARKLRITGNGRCNLTNNDSINDFITHFGRNGKFLRPVFSRFFAPELRAFFYSIGVILTKDETGRVYPRSNSADEVADALLKWAVASGVKIITDSTVKQIIVDEANLRGVRLAGNDSAIEADAVIVATGGSSYPATGSSGDGYTLAKALGHTIVPIRPASVPLIISSNAILKLAGISLCLVTTRVKIDGKIIQTELGDILFTHFGLSGPAILNLSRNCVDQLRAGKRPIISIDLLPEYDDNKLDRLLLSKMRMHGKSQIQTIIGELLPNRMATTLLMLDSIDPTKQCSQISSDERQKIKTSLKEFALEITGHRSLASAMVTAGGVSLKEINPQTMESRLVKGLYFAGEVLDLDADTGGYNLQAAFSTGWLAGQASVIAGI